jgi:hypothetical protein
MGPGVREHEIAQRVVAGGEAIVPKHASALQAAAREDVAGTTMSNNTRPVCTWGMDGGFTNPRRNQFEEFCCHAGYRGLKLCAHEGCYANVHHRCQ